MKSVSLCESGIKDCIVCVCVCRREEEGGRKRLHMTSTWLHTSAPFTCYPDRLKTLKTLEEVRAREEKEGGEREG